MSGPEGTEGWLVSIYDVCIPKRIKRNSGTLNPKYESPYVPHSSSARDVNRLACKHITCIATTLATPLHSIKVN